jgi:hypothetical protein
MATLFNIGSSANPMGNEHMLIRSPFNTSEMVNGNLALANIFQSILITEPGTYPTNPTLGIGIQAKYPFEFLDDYTVSQLRNEIYDQISTFVPGINLFEVTIEQLPNQSSTSKTIGIMFTVGSVDMPSPQEMVILLTQNTKNSRVVSQIYI